MKPDELKTANDQLEVAKQLVTELNNSSHTKELRNRFALKVFLKRVIRVSKRSFSLTRRTD